MFNALTLAPPETNDGGEGDTRGFHSALIHKRSALRRLQGGSGTGEERKERQ